MSSRSSSGDGVHALGRMLMCWWGEGRLVNYMCHSGPMVITICLVRQGEENEVHWQQFGFCTIIIIIFCLLLGKCVDFLCLYQMFIYTLHWSVCVFVVDNALLSCEAGRHFRQNNAPFPRPLPLRKKYTCDSLALNTTLNAKLKANR